MSPRIIVTALAAAAGALCLAACETETTTAPASVDTAKADTAVNPSSARASPPEAAQQRQRSPNDIGPGAPLEAPPVQ